MSRSAELLRIVAMLALGSATVVQLVGIRSRSGAATGIAAAVPSASDAVGLVASELRRIEGGGLLDASPRAIALRVPAAVGVVCATDGAETVMAVLPSEGGSPHSGATGMGWYGADGAFGVHEGRLTVRPARARACTAAAIDVPAGTTYLAVSPAAAGARVGTPAVLFDRVEYELRGSARVRGALALWRTAGGGTRELFAPIDPNAGFRFYVDAAAVPTATVPMPLERVRGIELSMAAQGAARADALLATTVFFRHDAS